MSRRVHRRSASVTFDTDKHPPAVPGFILTFAARIFDDT
jgi:hypothetical protein